VCGARQRGAQLSGRSWRRSALPGPSRTETASSGWSSCSSCASSSVYPDQGRAQRARIALLGQIRGALQKLAGSSTCDWAVEKIVHFPGRSFPRPLLRRLDALHLPGAVHIPTMALAARTRVASVTLGWWEELAEPLALARAAGPLRLLLGDDEAEPGWASGSFAHALAAVAAPRLGHRASGLPDERAAAAAAADLSPGRVTQKALLAALLPIVVPVTPEVILARRVRRFLPVEAVPDDALLQAVASTLRSLEGVPATFVIAVLRTWLAVWPTHHRQQRGRLPCRVCRGEVEVIEHLLECPVLWQAASSAARIPAPRSLLGRLALLPSPVVEEPPRRARKARRRTRPPPSAVMVLAIAADTFQRINGGARGAVLGLARDAFRRFGEC